MKFYVKFTSTVYADLVNVQSVEVGLNLLDRAREELSIPQLDAGLLNENTEKINRMAISVAIPEKVARESGLYLEHNTRTVTVPSLWANQFVEYELVAEMDETTGEIQKVTFTPRVSGDEMLTIWIAAGYPTSFDNEDGRIRS